MGHGPKVTVVDSWHLFKSGAIEDSWMCAMGPAAPERSAIQVDGHTIHDRDRDSAL